MTAYDVRDLPIYRAPAEFSEIEHSEAEGEDWRAAYAERIADGVVELKQERHAQVKRRLYVGTDVYVVKDLTDAQIEKIARIDAARACEQAIRELAEGERVAKRNQGLAQ